jgi:dienelactone hydrolase
MTQLEQVPYTHGETQLTGRMALPADTPRAAVAVFPTIMNSTPAVEAKALALAEAGYIAFVADFYGEPVADFPHSQALSKALVADPDHFRARLTAALEAMRALPEAAGLPQAAIGFCMGGMAVLDLARMDADLFAVVSFHGLLETGRKADRPIGPRILVCHGDADALVPRSHVIAFWEEMDAVGARWHFHSYAGVQHGFTNPNPSPANGALFYNSSADRHSWASTLELFDECLG